VYASATALVAFPKFEMPWKGFPPPETNVLPWIITFSIICSAGAVSLLAYTALGYYASLQASRSLFLGMLKRLVRAPSRFLDVTPIGRILNRFTAGLADTPLAFHGLTRGFRYQDRGRGTPKLRAGCNRWNAQLFYLILGHHLGCTSFCARGGSPRLVLYQDRVALHPSIQGSQTVGIDILISRLLRIRRIAERVTTHSSVRNGGKIPRIVLRES
jgi:ABC-type multidrug transport system fused ATPase/permease subunit